MSIGFFIIGGIIFSLYMYFTIWNIVHSSKEQKKQNYPDMVKRDVKREVKKEVKKENFQIEEHVY